jgi:hypothetical protein
VASGGGGTLFGRRQRARANDGASPPRTVSVLWAMGSGITHGMAQVPKPKSTQYWAGLMLTALP